MMSSSPSSSINLLKPDSTINNLPQPRKKSSFTTDGDGDDTADATPAFPDESPTLPPTPNENGGLYNTTPPPLTISSNPNETSSPLSNTYNFPTSPRKLSDTSDSSTTTRASSTQGLRAPFSVPATTSSLNNSPQVIGSPTYLPVNSPTTTPPPTFVNNGLQSSPGSNIPRHRNSMNTNHHLNPMARQSISINSRRHHHIHDHHRDGRRNNLLGNEPLIPPAPPVPQAPAPAMYWSKIRTHGKTPARALRAHTVNLVGELMYVFGGCDARTCFSNVYVFDADTMYWCKPRIFGDPPPACRAHSSTLVDKKLFIFGGGDGPVYFNDLFIFDTDTLTWSKPTTSGNLPSPRRAHTTVYYNNRIHVFGGGDGSQALNDVYALNISDLNNLVWEEIEPLGRPPISRGYHTSNLVGSKLVVYGGSDGHECFKDVHVLDLDTNSWIQVPVENSYPRLSHTATQVGSYLFVVCGHDGAKYTSDILLLNLVTLQWETRKVYGSPPSGRGYHTTVLHDSRLFVFGGYDGHTVFDDVFVLDLSACAYLPQITNFQLPEL
ncbi:hypothetical protein G9A89_000038 [Geosiphon pyriformis]|nr:hypothetical protein G9A89_000038 [Geosiphon pyriformis]